jgi:hypothetical protein
MSKRPSRHGSDPEERKSKYRCTYDDMKEYKCEDTTEHLVGMFKHMSLDLRDVICQYRGFTLDEVAKMNIESLERVHHLILDKVSEWKDNPVDWLPHHTATYYRGHPQPRRCRSQPVVSEPAIHAHGRRGPNEVYLQTDGKF